METAFFNIKMNNKMKTLTKILIPALLLIFLASFSGCGEEPGNIANLKGIWVCNPEPNVTITLTFETGKVYVNTSPQNLADTLMSAGKYLFNNSTQYIVRGDTLSFVDTNSNVPANYGFVGTMISQNEIKLQSYGIQFDALFIYIKDYTFIHNND